MTKTWKLKNGVSVRLYAGARTSKPAIVPRVRFFRMLSLSGDGCLNIVVRVRALLFGAIISVTIAGYLKCSRYFQDSDLD